MVQGFRIPGAALVCAVLATSCGWPASQSGWTDSGFTQTCKTTHGSEEGFPSGLAPPPGLTVMAGRPLRKGEHRIGFAMRTYPSAETQSASPDDTQRDHASTYYWGKSLDGFWHWGILDWLGLALFVRSAGGRTPDASLSADESFEPTAYTWLTHVGLAVRGTIRLPDHGVSLSGVLETASLSVAEYWRWIGTYHFMCQYSCWEHEHAANGQIVESASGEGTRSYDSNDEKEAMTQRNLGVFSLGGVAAWEATDWLTLVATAMLTSVPEDVAKKTTYTASNKPDEDYLTSEHAWEMRRVVMAGGGLDVTAGPTFIAVLAYYPFPIDPTADFGPGLDFRMGFGF